MTDEQAFFEAIRRRPDDDLPRLIYADWLEEPWQPSALAARAAFIRQSCEDKPNGNPWFRKLYDIEVAMRSGLDGYLDDQSTPGPNTANPFAPGLVWVRGFVEEVRCPSAAWLKCGDALLIQNPAVRTVRLTDRPDVQRYGNAGKGGHLDCKRTIWLPWQSGPRVPWEGDGQFYATRRLPTAEELLVHGWPGVRFELPPEPATIRPGELEYAGSEVISSSEVSHAFLYRPVR